MPVIYEQIASGGQFTGVAGAGLVDFDTAYEGEGVAPVIKQMFFTLETGVTLDDLVCEFRPVFPSDSSEAMRVAEFTAANPKNAFTKVGCIPAPASGDPTVEYWNLYLLTGVLPSAATFYCYWELEAL